MRNIGGDGACWPLRQRAVRRAVAIEQGGLGGVPGNIARHDDVLRRFRHNLIAARIDLQIDHRDDSAERHRAGHELAAHRAVVGVVKMSRHDHVDVGREPFRDIDDRTGDLVAAVVVGSLGDAALVHQHVAGG